MECPSCGQLNSDGASVCHMCGLPLFVGGASIDTAQADGKSPMVIAGNIDFPPPPSLSSLAKKPLSAQLPKPPPLPKFSTGAAPTATETSEQNVAAEDFLSVPFTPPPSLVTAPGTIALSSRPAHLIYAGFWYRFLAWLIDVAVLGVTLGMLGAGILMASAVFAIRNNNSSESVWLFVEAYGVMLLVNIIGSLLYFSLSESSRWQGTLGKLAIGLKVTDGEGNRLSFLRALGRYVTHAITNLTFGIGYLVNVFTARQQALHDLIAGTLVVHRNVTPDDLELNPAVPARAAQKVSALLVWVMTLLFLVSVALVSRTLVDESTLQQTTGVSLKMYEAEMYGAQATAAAADYEEVHGNLPPTLDAAGFHQSSPEVNRLWIDADNGAIHVELAFSPLAMKTLDYVPERDEDGSLIWYCHSNDIAPQYLPEHCR